MSRVHELIGIAALASNALAAGWGSVSWLRSNPSIAFWPILRVAQLLVVVEAVAGLVLVGGGHKAPDSLHYVYGIAPLVVSLVSEGMRAGAAGIELRGVEDPEALERAQQVALARRIVQREMGIMTVGALLVLTLLIRAAQSG